jgi:hypothetical protein
MLRIILAAVFLIGLSVASTVFAATAAAAMNKTVEMNWRENRTDKMLWSGKVSQVGIQTKLTIYISSKGQVFSEMNRSGNVSRQAGDNKPEGNNPLTWKIQNWHFEGRTLVALQKFGPTGARRISIEFDDNYRTCRATIQSGRTASAKTTIATYMHTGEQVEVLAEEIQPPTCSVRDGNAFGN